MKIALPMLGCLFAVVILISPEASSAPSVDYDNDDVPGVRELYEGLKRAAYPEREWRIVRKDNRSPQLRLRFGRRSAPPIPMEDHHLDHSRMDYFEN